MFGAGWQNYWKWTSGAMTTSGVIYCPPCNLIRGILNIDTNTDNVTELDRDLLPELRGVDEGDMWTSCALTLDGCMYFMPGQAEHECRRRLGGI